MLSMVTRIFSQYEKWQGNWKVAKIAQECAVAAYMIIRTVTSALG